MAAMGRQTQAKPVLLQLKRTCAFLLWLAKKGKARASPHLSRFIYPVWLPGYFAASNNSPFTVLLIRPAVSLLASFAALILAIFSTFNS